MHKELSQREAIWRSYRHQDFAILRVKRSQFFHHKIIKIQEYGVVYLIHMNPTSQRRLQLEFA
jgi:hypothetical protein